MTADTQRLQQNLQTIRERIRRASRARPESDSQVRLVAVTKSVRPETAALLPPLGLCDLGENRTQLLAEKVATMGPDTSIHPREAPPLRWHMIGTIQRKKAPQVLASCSWIHSVDSPKIWARLCEVLQRRRETGAASEAPTMLIQVNISGEQSKHGFSPPELSAFLDTLDPQCELRPAGLMTMAPLSSDPEASRTVFAALADLSRRLRAAGAPLGKELSMGMSTDFEVAIEEGATVVRIGTKLFEGVE